LEPVLEGTKKKNEKKEKNLNIRLVERECCSENVVPGDEK
jgi:hypothetical protein